MDNLWVKHLDKHCPFIEFSISWISRMLQSSRLNVFILAPRMGVTDVMLQPFLEGWPLHQVIEAKRLFMVDLEILQGLPCKSEEYVVNNDTFIIHCGNTFYHTNYYTYYWLVPVCFPVSSPDSFVFCERRRTIGSHRHSAVSTESWRQSSTQNISLYRTTILKCL